MARQTLDDEFSRTWFCRMNIHMNRNQKFGQQQDMMYDYFAENFGEGMVALPDSIMYKNAVFKFDQSSCSFTMVRE